jgi:hypothetical protein
VCWTVSIDIDALRTISKCALCSQYHETVTPYLFRIPKRHFVCSLDTKRLFAMMDGMDFLDALYTIMLYQYASESCYILFILHSQTVQIKKIQLGH